MLSIIATLETAFSELLPSLSTALIKYVPVIAGTITVLAGLETLSAMSIELAYVAPLVSFACLIR